MTSPVGRSSFRADWTSRGLGLIVGLCLAGCVYRPDGGEPSPSPSPRPSPRPAPMTELERTLHSVIVNYARGCGESLVETPAGRTEADYNRALREARSAARLAAHRPEDERLSGDVDANRKIGEAWLSLAKRLEGVK